MNIFKTFEIFLREPLSILKDRIIQIVNINTNMASEAAVTVDLLDKKAQITVVNSDKMYNLLKTVTSKKTASAAQKLMSSPSKSNNNSNWAESRLPPRRGQVVLGQLCKRT